MKPRIGVVGLGNIAQKAYLPILTREKDWTLVGAFTPNAAKRKQVCQAYRIQEFKDLPTLIQACDAVFVHSSTESHEEVVATLLQQGKDVYVDKPLASTVEGAERLAELSEKKNRKLMVGFNRRFAPLYVEAANLATELAWVRFEKHRHNSIGPQTLEFTMLDDYLHLIDTVRWLSGSDLSIATGQIKVTDQKEMVFAHHVFTNDQGISYSTAMHRNVGTGLELLELANEGSILRVKNMNMMEKEENMAITTTLPGSWDTILKQRGFEGAINHFIESILGNTKPQSDGWEGLKSQQLVEQLLTEYKQA